MTDRETNIIRVALAMLVSGRAKDCRETLELVLRENGGTEPTAPKPPVMPLWMRPSA